MTETSASITNPAYRYGFRVTGIFDGDTIVGDVDMFDHLWKEDEVIRLYGINSQEIRRSRAKGLTSETVEVGYEHRDALIRLLGLDPSDFPRKVKYHTLAAPVWVVIETIKDEAGKFGRLLGVLHKDGVNLNEAMRDVIGSVEFYDGRNWPANTPIRPPI